MRSMGRPDGARPGGMRVAATSCLRQLQEKLRQLLIAGSHALAMVPDCRVGRPGMARAKGTQSTHAPFVGAKRHPADERALNGAA